jgi:hypothetical protein
VDLEELVDLLPIKKKTSTFPHGVWVRRSRRLWRSATKPQEMLYA